MMSIFADVWLTHGDIHVLKEPSRVYFRFNLANIDDTVVRPTLLFARIEIIAPPG